MAGVRARARRRAAHRRARCSSPATATRPRRSSASAPSASGSASASSGCSRAPRAGSSPRSRRTSGSRCTSPTTSRSIPGRSSGRWPRAWTSARASRSPSLDDVEADTVVLAAGAWSAQLADVPVRPVKGQILRLRDPNGPGLVDRVVRFEGGYLVPRGDGRYVLGATVEERGFDTTVTAGGLYELLRDATEVVPGHLRARRRGDRGGPAPRHARATRRSSSAAAARSSPRATSATACCSRR